MGEKLKARSNQKHEIRSSGGVFSNKSGYLNLADGVSFAGVMPEWQSQDFAGEVVFNTGMTGYVESLTDPSYAGQILTFTYPLIGNYGVNEEYDESDKIQVSGVIMSEVCLDYSHEGSVLSLTEWLKSQNIPLLSGVDTRALTKHLREQGTMGGVISSRKFKPTDVDLSTKFVSVSDVSIYNPEGKKTVVLVDCGMKNNILRSLVSLGLKVKRVPLDYDYTKEDYDGVLLSNGPGDPSDYVRTIEIAKSAMTKNKPIFGICLGSQIMGLAAGMKTYKLKFGHRGHNQPCFDSDQNKAYITSQNHGYAIDDKSLPNDWRVFFRNLNDNSIEGIEHKSKPFFSVQFHPEASPGPTDTNWLFERFVSSL